MYVCMYVCMYVVVFVLMCLSVHQLLDHIFTCIVVVYQSSFAEKFKIIEFKYIPFRWGSGLDPFKTQILNTPLKVVAD